MTQYTFRGNSPQPIVGTERNQERTGKRRVSRLSAIARRVEDVRGIDVDYVQYCPRCRYPQAFCEVKSREVHDKEWEQVRILASHYGNHCVALLIIEAERRLGYKEYFSSTNLFMAHATYGTEEDILLLLEHARDIHECQLQ